MRIAWLIVGIIFFISCSSDRKYIIPRDEMVDILIDIHLTEALFTMTRIRDAKYGFVDTLDMYDSIIYSHGYTPAMYDSTIRYYSRRVEKFEEIYDEVIAELNKMEGQVLDSLKNRNIR